MTQVDSVRIGDGLLGRGITPPPGKANPDLGTSSGVGYSFAQEYHIGRHWIELRPHKITPVDPQDAPTLEELQAHLRPILASYKKPTSIDVVSVLPRNTMGRVLHSQVKQEQAAKMGGRR